MFEFIIFFFQDFIFIHLHILRQYLSEDLKLPGLLFEWDLERVIDDWVFLCFFVGNDFLPHLPSLEIREGAIDRLIEIYKSTVRKSDGWLTDSGRVCLDRVQLIMVDLGRMEDEIFKNRRDSELKFRERRKRQNNYAQPQRPGRNPNFEMYAPAKSGFMEPLALSGRESVTHPRGRYSGSNVTAAEVHNARRNSNENVKWVDQNLNNLEAATALRVLLKDRRRPSDSADEYVSPKKISRLDDDRKKGRFGGNSASDMSGSFKDEDEKMDALDEVRFWEEGWRSRYYHSKFGVDPEDAPQFCQDVSRQYAFGLCWVLAYYYQGCVSWNWYFPYHYAPFASDFGQIDDLDPGFKKTLTKPFRPLEQLMSVFPAASRQHVPQAWQDLMTDVNSPIIDFYPTNFKIDLNGKRYLWMGVALLPYVDEKRLLKALDDRRHLLTEDELMRNVRGPDRLFCHRDHELAICINSLYQKAVDVGKDEPTESKLIPDEASVVDPRLTNGMAGLIWTDKLAYQPGHCVPSPVPGLIKDLKSSKAVSVCFADPQYPDEFVFSAQLLKRVGF